MNSDERIRELNQEVEELKKERDEYKKLYEDFKEKLDSAAQTLGVERTTFYEACEKKDFTGLIANGYTSKKCLRESRAELWKIHHSICNIKTKFIEELDGLIKKSAVVMSHINKIESPPIKTKLPVCPQCGKPLVRVTQDTDSYLNAEQFDSVKAGDYFCETCKDDSTKTGYKYFWEKDLE